MPYSVENKLLKVAVKKMLHSGVALSYHSFKIDFFSHPDLVSNECLTEQIIHPARSLSRHLTRFQCSLTQTPDDTADFNEIPDSVKQAVCFGCWCPQSARGM